jgi:hypothetical protein
MRYYLDVGIIGDAGIYVVNGFRADITGKWRESEVTGSRRFRRVASTAAPASHATGNNWQCNDNRFSRSGHFQLHFTILKRCPYFRQTTTKVNLVIILCANAKPSDHSDDQFAEI